MIQPRQYQIEGINFLKSSRRNILTDDPGLGKTLQGLMSIGVNQPAMVVCPKSVKQVWATECANVRPDLKPVVLSGKLSFKYPEPGELVIINPDILPQNISTWNVPREMRLLVDEAHMFKSTKAERTKKMNKLTLAIHALAGSTSFLTGTPITSNPSDLWGILFALNLIPETYGSWNNFMKMFRGVMTPIGIKWGQPHPLAMNPLRPFMFGRKRENVAKDIPPKTWERYVVEVNQKLVDNINITEEQLENAIDKGEPMLHLSTWRAMLAMQKAEESLDYIETVAESEPVVVFSAHKSAIEKFNKPGWGIITGDVPQERRNALVYDFQQGKLKGIAGTIGAMGVGLTLTKSNRLFMIDRDWNPSMNRQAEDRVCRLGQDRKVIITDIISSSKLDQIISNVLIRKSKLINQTVDTLKV